MVYIKSGEGEKENLVNKFHVHKRRFESSFWIKKYFMFTGDGFSLNSGFTKISCTAENPLDPI